jgi:hypothetical protein
LVLAFILNLVTLVPFPQSIRVSQFVRLALGNFVVTPAIYQAPNNRNTFNIPIPIL